MMSYFGHFPFSQKDLGLDQKAKMGTNVCFLSLVPLKAEECFEKLPKFTKKSRNARNSTFFIFFLGVHQTNICAHFCFI